MNIIFEAITITPVADDVVVVAVVVTVTTDVGCI